VTGWGLIATLFCPEICADDAADCIPTPATMWLQPYAENPWSAITDHVPEPMMPYVVPTPGQTLAVYQQDPVVGPWETLTQPAWSSLFNTGLAPHNAACLILCGLWGAMVWAFFGAVICRTAAVRLAADEQVGLGAALRFAGRKWPSYFFAPVLPIGVVIVMTAVVAMLGLLMQTTAGLVFAGLFWFLVLLAAFLMAVLLLCTLFGWPLMWGAISAEGSDTFDALSRSYAYTWQRPLRYVFYIVVATFLGWLGWIFVRYFAAGTIWLGYWAAGFGCGSEQIESIIAGGEGFGAGAIRFWAGCVRLLAVGYLFSYFWAASAAIYFLLRHDVDATEMDEVFLDADATEQEPALPAVAAEQSASPIVNGELT
jgi:hypothetical protein